LIGLENLAEAYS